MGNPGVLEIDSSAAGHDFKEFVDRFGGPAMALAINVLGNKEDAEDACQEAFIRVFRNLERVDAEKNFKNWVYTIIYHCALDILKKRRKARRLFEVIRNESQSSGRPNHSPAGGRELLSGDVLKRLNLKERTALSLWANEGYTSAEISEVMGCSSGTARVHLYNARRKIKARWEGNHA